MLILRDLAKADDADLVRCHGRGPYNQGLRVRCSF
jgi:hypothetical protein